MNGKNKPLKLKNSARNVTGAILSVSFLFFSASPNFLEVSTSSKSELIAGLFHKSVLFSRSHSFGGEISAKFFPLGLLFSFLSHFDREEASDRRKYRNCNYVWLIFFSTSNSSQFLDFLFFPLATSKMKEQSMEFAAHTHTYRQTFTRFFQ